MPRVQAADRELADDMVVVMFSRAEREASVYYGADEGPQLEDRWEPAVDAMIPELRAGDYTGAIDAALRVLRTGGSSGLSSTLDDSSDGGGADIPVLAIVLVILAVGVLLYQGYRVASGDATWSEAFGDGDDDSEWYSSGSRSSWRSWSSRRGRSSRSSGRGGGSRRAGGGSKKW